MNSLHLMSMRADVMRDAVEAGLRTRLGRLSGGIRWRWRRRCRARYGTGTQDVIVNERRVAAWAVGGGSWTCARRCEWAIV